jgi:DNA modification methylase
MTNLQIEQTKIASLRPYKRNARTHSDKQIHQIAASIKAFGFTNPVLIDATNTIIAGHGRVEAAKRLKLSKVPTIRLEHLSETELRAYVIADNRLAENAGWDDDVLAIELQHLSEVDLDFSVEVTGFETAEVDFLIDDGQESTTEDSPEEDGFALADTAVTQTGDIWLLGDHRLICGDSLQEETYKALMEIETARMVFTDPPYNVPVQGHVSGLGRARHSEFAMASGEMSSDEFVGFLAKVLGHLKQYSMDGALLYVCMDWRHVGEMDRATLMSGLATKNICVWVKSNGGMGSLYRSRHELVFVLKSGTAPHVNNVQLGRYGRYRTNVWEYAGVNSFGKTRDADLEAHPTVKPVTLVADAIRDCSKRHDIILDTFGGSGTTLLAAERTGRKARLIEIDPAYCDVTIRRWQSMTGKDAVLAIGGACFDLVAEQRAEDGGIDNVA